MPFYPTTTTVVMHFFKSIAANEMCASLQQLPDTITILSQPQKNLGFGCKKGEEGTMKKLMIGSFETHNLHCQPLEGSRTPFRFLWPAILHTNGTFTPSITLCAQADFGHYPFLKGTGGRSEYNFDKKTWKAKRSGGYEPPAGSPCLHSHKI